LFINLFGCPESGTGRQIVSVALDSAFLVIEEGHGAN
jgi:hypothetical protein